MKNTQNERAKAILKDILINHLPRIQEGLEKGYVDENQILIMYDHAVRSRILTEHAAEAELSEWKYLGGVQDAGGATEVMAAKSEDGIGIIARWMLDTDGTWRSEVWHTEMPSEGIRDDDSGSVPETPPVFHPSNAKADRIDEGDSVKSMVENEKEEL